jgi:hypothetical protein
MYNVYHLYLAQSGMLGRSFHVMENSDFTHLMVMGQEIVQAAVEASERIRQDNTVTAIITQDGRGEILLVNADGILRPGRDL